MPGVRASESASQQSTGRNTIFWAEFAANNSDDDNADQKRTHSSTKKKSKDDDDSDKPAALPTPSKKKKKPVKDDDSTAAAGDTPKKSSVSDGDETPPSKKAPKKKSEDDSTPAPKSKTPDEKLSNEKPSKSPGDDAAAKDSTAKNSKYAPDASVDPGAITQFSAQPEKIQKLITAALDLTKLNLTYTYGSAEPSNGGMDCSGTIYYLLRSQGFQDVPRDSSSQYVWARKRGKFYAVVSTKADSFEFNDLQPGDLMFWSGTYQTERDIPISHVMLYLGIEKRTGKRIMFGSSDGRSYDGLQRWGVSVFDFKMPTKGNPDSSDKRHPEFVGYARIPGLREEDASSKTLAEVGASHDEKEKSADEKAPSATSQKEKDQNPDASTPPPKKKSATKKSTPRKRSQDDD